MQFYTPVTVSRNQAKTPEGFLICYGSVIARTGQQIYGPGELDVEAGPDGYITVQRDESEVFSPETIASFEGKDIVITHPDSDVTPENWADLSRGHVQNVRRGTGIEDHLLLADLVFKHPEAIMLVEQNPTHELSCGYEALYEVTGPGRANQVHIRGNHVALVDKGRCGPVCATKDHLPQGLKQSVTNTDTISPIGCDCGTAQPEKFGDSMSKKSWLDRVRDAFTAKDEAGMKAALDDVESIMNLTGNPDSNESQTHVHLYLGEPATTKPEGGLPETGEARVTSAKDDAAKVGGEHEATFGGKSFFTDAKLEEEFKGIKDSIEALNKKVDDAFPPKDKEDTKDKEPGEESAHEKADKEIEGELEEEAPPGTGDKAKKAKDSALLEDSFAETVSMAAILVPSIAIPTFDKATDPKSTLTSICALRRKALKAYSVTTDGAEVLAKITKRANLDTMPCAYLAPIFRGAAATQAARNEAAAVQRNTQDAKLFGSREDSAPAIRTLADVQRANDEFNAKQAAGL